VGIHRKVEVYERRAGRRAKNPLELHGRPGCEDHEGHAGFGVHIVEQKSEHFDPSKFEDHYEAALQDLLNKKQKGQPLPKAAPKRGDNVVDLMSALRASIQGTGKDANPTPIVPYRSRVWIKRDSAIYHLNRGIKVAEHEGAPPSNQGQCLRVIRVNA
jgi:hypothetical protein